MTVSLHGECSPKGPRNVRTDGATGVPEIRSSVLAAHAHLAHYTATASSSPDLHTYRHPFDHPTDPHVRVGDLLTEAPAENIRNGPARERVEMGSEMRTAVVRPANGMGGRTRTSRPARS